MADIRKNINITADTSNADQALGGLANKLDGVSSGNTKVTASTNAMGKAQKASMTAVLANGGAVGTLSNLLGSNVMAFKDAIEAIELTGVSLRGLRGAIIATGIGALVVIIGELVANWDKWVGMIDGSTAAIDNLNKGLKTHENFLKSINIRMSEEIANKQNQIALLTAQGAKQSEINKLLNELSEIEKNLADLALYGTEAESGLIDKLGEALKLRQTLSEGSDKWIENEEKVLELQQKVADAAVAKNKALSDPQVRAAQEATEKRNKAIADSIKKQAEAQRIADAEMKKHIDSMLKYAQVVDTISVLTRKFSDKDLSAEYIQLRTLTEQYLQNQAALKGLILEKEKLGKKDTENRKIADTAIKNAKLNEEAIKREIQLTKEVQEGKDKLSSKEQAQNRILLMNNFKLVYLEDQYFSSITKTTNAIEDKASTMDYLATKHETERRLLTAQQALEELSISDDYNRLTKRKAFIDDYLAKFKEGNTEKIERLNELNAIESDKLTEAQRREKEGLDLQLVDYFNFKDQKSDIDNQINENNKASNDLLLAQQLETNVLEIEQHREKIEAKQALDDAYLQANMDHYAKLGQTIEGFSELAGKETAAGKALAIAAATINTFVGISEVWAAKSMGTPVLDMAVKVASTALVAASGIANVAKIVAVKVPGNSGGGGGAPSAPYNPPAQFNMVGNSGQNQLAQTIGEAQNRPVNAYVVSGEMTSQQAIDRNRAQNSTFL